MEKKKLEQVGIAENTTDQKTELIRAFAKEGMNYENLGVLKRDDLQNMIQENVYVDNINGYYNGALIFTITTYDRERRGRWVDAVLDPEKTMSKPRNERELVYSSNAVDDGTSIVPLVIEAMNAVDGYFTRMKTPVIAVIDDMEIDMHYHYWKTAIRATYEGKSVTLDINGFVIGIDGCRLFDENSGFPQEKLAVLRSWIKDHQQEIIDLHQRCAVCKED